MPRMKLSVMLVALLFVAAYAVYRHPYLTRAQASQNSNSAAPCCVSGSGGIIDGSQHPEMIPDDRAYQMVLLAASASDDDSDEAKLRSAAVVRSIHRRAADATNLSGIAKRYRASFLQFIAEALPDGDEATYEETKRNLVKAAVHEIGSGLTPLGQAELRVYVENEKHHMKLYPLPDMRPQHSSLWRRLLATQQVYAQGMQTYGTTYTNESVGGTAVYATGVTDTSASCSCHESSVSVTIIAPGGQASNSSGVGSAYAQTEAVYELTDTDFTDGQIQVDSTYYSYCPIIDYAFLQSTAIDYLPLKSIHAYYYYQGNDVYHRCNPTGAFCDNVFAWGSTRPSYVLAKVYEIDIRSSHFCAGKTDKVVDKCYSPDPKP